MEGSHPPVTASRETAELRERYRLFVDGKFVEGNGELLTTINPATEEVLAEVSTADKADVDTAVRAARKAYDRTWSRMPGAERAKYLFRIARLIQERSRELAVLASLESGEPIRESGGGDVPGAAAHFFYHAGWADKLGYAGYGPDPKPLGVAGQIIPCDTPLLVAARSVAPALSCGNTVVLKPAGTTPLTALLLADICQQADLPSGVLNVLPGAGNIGATLAAHDGLSTVAFTGSTEVGTQVQRALAGTGRKLALSLGGPATIVVFADAPLDQAVDAIVTGVFTQGAGSRLLVAEPVAEQVLAMLRARVATLRVGDPLDPHTDVGAITSRARLARLRDLTDSANATGAQRWTSPAVLPERGLFFPPTVFSQVSRTMRIAREEITGPVLPVLTFSTPDEAVAEANTTPTGHCASIWTESGSRIQWATRQLRARVVWANTSHRFDPSAPFGGYRGSGLTQTGGRVGLGAYLDV